MIIVGRIICRITYIDRRGIRAPVAIEIVVVAELPEENLGHIYLYFCKSHNDMSQRLVFHSLLL